MDRAMVIYHRISINSISGVEFFSVIQGLGIKYKVIELPGEGGSLVSIDITETDPNWPKIYELATQNNALNIIETFFTEEEIRKAAWLRIMAFEHGAPQPELTWPIKQSSYENVCPKCAVHLQTRNMRLKKEPKLRNKSFMSLMGAGEIFATSEVFLELNSIQAKGYQIWDAIIHKTNLPSEVIHQIYVPGIASPGLIIDENLKEVICPICHITKYYSHMKGIMKIKKDAIPPGTDFVQTYEWFGSGFIACHEILISNRIAQLFLDKGWQGIRLKVVELV